MLRAGRHQQSRILILLFAVWVLSPFLAGVLAHIASERWSILTRKTLSVVMLVLTVGSLIIYGNTAFGHSTAKVGFVFLMVPLASWLWQLSSRSQRSSPPGCHVAVKARDTSR
jgi:hypothetical protein